MITATSSYAAKIKVSANLNLGLDYREIKNEGELFFDAKVKLESKRIKGVKAILEAEAESDEREFETQEAYINYKIDDTNKLYLGHRKSRLGLESVKKSRERFFSKRSILSDKLEQLAYVSYQPQVIWKNKNDDHNYRIALGLPSSLDYNIQMSGMWNLSETTSLGTWLILQRNERYEASADLVFATSASLECKWDTVRADLEITYGKDPIESELRSQKKDEDIYFYGGKSTVDFAILPEQVSNLRAGIRLASLVQNHKLTSDRLNSIGGGVSYVHSEMISYHLNGDVVAQHNPYDSDDISYLKTRFILETRVHF